MIHEHSSFTGVWTVAEATLPTGAFAYTGTITIGQRGAAFVLDWDISAGRYVGVGLVHDEHLFVACGEQWAGLGVALYRQSGEIAWCAGECPAEIGAGRFAMPWQGEWAGEHTVEYRFTDGRTYGAWTLAAHDRGQVYDVRWLKDGQPHFRGIGLPTAGGVAVGWYPDRAQLALLDYSFATGDGRLHAVWALGAGTTLGTETLVRRS
jgi:hypothetical protein